MELRRPHGSLALELRAPGQHDRIEGCLEQGNHGTGMGGEMNCVWHCRFSPGGAPILSGSHDKTLRLRRASDNPLAACRLMRRLELEQLLKFECGEREELVKRNRNISTSLRTQRLHQRWKLQFTT